MNNLSIRLLTMLSLALTAALCARSGVPSTQAQINQLTPEEVQAGWKLLFDGKSLAGWRGFKQQELPSQGWVVANGVLTKVAKVRGGDLVTGQTFDDFEFSWEWRLPEKANNGIKYFITEARASAIGHEYQMVDDLKNPDGMRGGKSATAAFYDVLPAKSPKPLKPVGEWNHSRVIVQGNHVEHWLNGEKVLAYECGSAEVKAAVAKSKFKSVAGFGDKIKGHILLTDHGDECSFRNLKLRGLPVK